MPVNSLGNIKEPDKNDAPGSVQPSGYLGIAGYDRGLLNEYERASKRKALFIVLVAAGIAVVGLVAVTLGPLEISVADSYRVILIHILPGTSGAADNIVDNTIWQVRLPRVLSALLVGFGLGVSGAVMQPALKNPMASPFTLGIATSAGFGASLAIAFGASIGAASVSVIGFAFLFSMISVIVILLVSKWKDASPMVIILTGIAIAYLFNAGIAILQYIVDPIYVKQMALWLSGSLYKGNWDNMVYIFPVVLVISIFLIIKSKDLNAISAGDEVAKSIGINVEQARLIMLVVSAILTATVVSFMGTIGFIGLVAPHIVRLVIGGDNRFVVIGAGFAGAFLLAISDIVALHAMTPIVLPVGVITSLMGVPLFLYLILRNTKGSL